MTEWLSTVLSPIWNALGAILLAGGGGAVVAYGIFHFLGESWLNHRFAKKMAAFTHEQDQQIERLRFRINALFDRRTKLHQREFEVVPEAWGLLFEAHHEVALFVAVLQQYADVDRMNDEELADFVAAQTFSDLDKRRLADAHDKGKVYRELVHFQRKRAVNNKLYEAFAFYKRNAIFMERELRDQFKEAIELMRLALLEHSMNFEHELRPMQRESVKAFESRGGELLELIQQKIQDRLWSPDEIDASTRPTHPAPQP